MKHISKRVREEAATLCSAWASNEIFNCDAYGASLGIGTTSRRWSLASAALDVALGDGFLPDNENYAEAECILRTGFIPEGWS